jgi:hypothetical protein
MWNRIQAWLSRSGKATAPKRPPTAPVGTPAPAGVPAPPHPSGKPPARAMNAPAPRGKHLVYAPKLDGQADPGEVIWTWVPFEEDASQGKDRPVLVVGRDGAMLLGLMLSSEAKRDGQHNWLALGAGDWDGQHRPSWLRLDRVLEVHEDRVRREGAILDKPEFDTIAKTLRSGYGWH